MGQIPKTSGGQASRQSRAQQVASSIEGEILEQRMAAGARVGLRTDLIRRFNVSATVINEALGILRERDLIEVKPGPNGGVFVFNPPPQVRLGGIDVWHQNLTVDPEDLFEARRYLDNLFAPVALQRAQPEDIQAMQWALDDMSAAQHDARASLAATMRLHLAIARASRIEVLVGIYQTITTTLTATMTEARFVAGMADVRGRHLQLHADIVAAIRDGDPIALEKLMSQHQENMTRIV
ncbi:FadR family transcriptional regulator [Mycobacterium sp. CBMA271]|uniref:FadR/GntR family transcriptional regulator n=1 Tax=unclassified Mycobacteroides TaxID=2618759 RepID=UPI0012DE6679|nr:MULTISPECIES: FCD domain-containing protein [unclassified Mycobacteroides]MUM18865.1 GntR family transcriptional regulator [Mycobacteroides sp. CBMA 326]MUM23195.1 FadR family transcriptional regulator [Mycobacteroides sp. CBMA 271]